MALAIHDIEDRDSGPREKLSRLLGVMSAIYGLLAVITGSIAAAGLFGLFGLAADPTAADPARLLGLPWSLAMGEAGSADPAATLLLALGGLTANVLILMVAAGLMRGRLRRL